MPGEVQAVIAIVVKGLPVRDRSNQKFSPILCFLDPTHVGACCSLNRGSAPFHRNIPK